MTRVQIGAASLASLIAMIQSGAAFAQGAPANPPAEAKSPASEEIVVTAQRRMVLWNGLQLLFPC